MGACFKPKMVVGEKKVYIWTTHYVKLMSKGFCGCYCKKRMRCVVARWNSDV